MRGRVGGRDRRHESTSEVSVETECKPLDTMSYMIAHHEAPSFFTLLAEVRAGNGGKPSRFLS